jgi:alanine racemase
MAYTLNQIAEITHGTLIGNPHVEVSVLLTDSRSLRFPNSVMFVALRGASGDGHKYIHYLLEKEVCAFLTESFPENVDIPQGVGFVVVKNSLEALQMLASEHRKKFTCPVIGITGSNGKTIVKEWLNQCLQNDYEVTRSPRSYNSQIGVPLSVWELSDKTKIGIFEAGISQPHEMERLAAIIKPTIGIFTNLGDAHQENFRDNEQKLKEKLLLFTDAETVITSSDNDLILNTFTSLFPNKKLVTWGSNINDDIRVTRKNSTENGTHVLVDYQERQFGLTIPFVDSASYQNAMNVVAFLCLIGYDSDTISHRIRQLQNIDMRLEMKAGRNNCTIINDSYNSDLVSLASSLEYLAAQNQTNNKVLVVSDILQSGLPPEALYRKVADLVQFYAPKTFIGVGVQISGFGHLFGKNSLFFSTTEDLIEYFEKFPPLNSTLLLKGSRTFRFERVDRMLQERQHRTVMEVNLDAMVSNLRYFRSKLNPGTKVIAMLKAFGYGSGSYELASILQHHRVDYLAVAFTDEAVHLRENGIRMPIMVMNPGVETFPELVEYNLEPEVFGFDFLFALDRYLAKNAVAEFPIHVKIDTGMNRSGFKPIEIEKFCTVLKSCKQVRVMSVFSHLAAADEPQFDGFTLQQISDFQNITEYISSQVNYHFFRHILNSAGTERFTVHQFDAVRLGIGLYGISFTSDQAIKQVATLRSRVMQVKEIEPGETIGYSRKGVVNQKSTIATIPIGYADGFRRILGNGKGKMLINGQPAPTIGNICMDMCMIDVTGMGVKEGDDVVVFGEGLPLSEVALDMETIPYEVLTGISGRIRRVYFRE